MKKSTQSNMNGSISNSMILLMDLLWSNVVATVALADRCCVGK